LSWLKLISNRAPARVGQQILKFWGFHFPIPRGWGGRLAQFPDEPTAGTFAWSADDALVIKLCAYETPYQTTFTLKFDRDQVTLDCDTNVAFGPTKRPQLVGRAD